MVDPSSRGRRIAIALVALIGAAATIATSQPIVESRLERSSAATILLDDASPKAVGRLVLALTPESLPVETSSGPRPSGRVGFVVDSARAVGGANAGSIGPIEISASVVGIPEPPQIDSGGPSWPIEELCRAAEPCRREFDVAVEWLQPKPGTSVEVAIQASLFIRYDRRETLPAGANGTWENGDFAAVKPTPALTARVELGAITLGLESPLAARHVLLRASVATLAVPGDLDITAYVRADLSANQPPRATVTVVPDGSTSQEEIGAGSFLTPFAGCARASECVRGFTVFARWAGLEPGEQVDLDWSFEAIARFPGDAGIPDDAALIAEVDDSVDLGPRSARLRAKATGSFDLQRAGDRTVGEVRLRVSAPALRDAFLGADIPAVAIVRLSANPKDPAATAGLQASVSAPNRPGVSHLSIADDGTELQMLVFPLGRCADAGPCIGSIGIDVESRAGREATISWQVTIDLPVPRPELASGEIQIEVVDAP